MQRGVSIINAIGSITFLLLTLVIYLSIKGRLGTYIALAMASNSQTQSSNAKQDTTTMNSGTITQVKPFVPSLKPIPPAQTSTGYPFLTSTTIPTIAGFPG